MPRKIKKNTYVINPLDKKELMDFLDPKSKDIIKYFIIKSLFAQPEPRTDQRQLPIQIPKEHIEQWFTQSLNVTPVGAGSYPIDIYNEKQHWGADIKMLNIKLNSSGTISNSESGEASLGQKFEGPGVDLDEMFHLGKYEDIKDKWISIYKQKYISLRQRYPIKKIYYFFILRPGTQIEGADLYFTGAVLNLDKLGMIKVNTDKTTKKSVFLDNFIAVEYGSTKIYKAKKRLELRLRPKRWVDDGMSVRISTSFVSNHVDLRDEKIDAEYLSKAIDKLKSLRVDFIE